MSSSPGRGLRIGSGFDVHPFVSGRPLVLGGVTIPFDKGLEGDSDADVLLHAIADALLGAVALGDLGHWYPPGESVEPGADSSLLLQDVVERVRNAGWVTGNLDSTLIAQSPRLAPHVPAMRTNLARWLDVPESRVSVKATTTDRLGFVGRGEGIAAQAIVLLESV